MDQSQPPHKVPNKPDDYRTPMPGRVRQGRPFEPLDGCGYTVIKPLQFLHGRPWDEIALAYVQALRPSHLRVVSEGAQCDAQAWRVTVWMDANNKIAQIDQEVQVGLPDGVSHGHHLDQLSGAAAYYYGRPKTNDQETT